MISNVRPRLEDPGMGMILAAIGGGTSPAPRQLEPGLFLIDHFSFDAYLTKSWDSWWSTDSTSLPPAFGVCDSPEQFKTKYLESLRSDPAEYVVAFHHIRKADEPADGGWRWHKWGEYVGEQEPHCEYIHDEPFIDEVYTFHVYRRATPSESKEP